MSDRPADTEALFRFLNEIGIIAQLSGNLFERAMPMGLTLAQFGVLNHLVRLGGTPTPVELARAFQVTKGAMTNTLKRLDARGFIAIAPDAKDGRSKRIALQPAGRAAREAAIAALAPELRELAGGVPVGEVVAATPVLERIRKLLDERRN